MITRITQLLLIVICLTSAIFSLTQANEMDIVPVSKIMEDKESFVGQIVWISGYVDTIIKGGDSSSTTKYYLKCRISGSLILISSNDKKPQPYALYNVKGKVGLEKNEVIFKEIAKVDNVKKSAESKNIKGSMPEGLFKWVGISFIGIFFVFGIATLVVRYRNNRMYDSYSTRHAPKHFHPDIAEEDTTIKYNPDDGEDATLKLLPGWLEVARGDTSRKEIRFTKSPMNTATEFTFGRKTGDNKNHIRLNFPTVSSMQAKMVMNNGKFSLINYSRTNPTVVNGNALAEGDIILLEEGMKIEMGEMAFIFHEK